MIQGFFRSSTAIACALAAVPAWAQTSAPADDQVGIKDIVVTAQRRNESVQDVPIAISAFSSDQLEAQGVTNTFQLGQYIPNLFALNNTGLGSANGYYLRGLGNTESIATFDPPVGTYVDDIYLSRQNANNLSLLDVERVEVLRGPQGTLFGRNTTGGAISVIMREPGKEVGGYAEAGYGRYNRLLLRGSIDLPLSSGFGVKVSAFRQTDDGYVKNVTTGETINDDNSWGVRLGVKGEITDSISWKGSYSHLENDAENTLNFLCNPAAPTQCNGRFATTGLREATTSGVSPFLPLVITGRKGFYGNGNRTQNDLLTSNLEFRFGANTTLNLITGFVNLGQQYALDFADGRGLPSLANPNPAVEGQARGGFAIINDGRHKQFTQEVKLGGSLANGLIDYVGGFFYIKETNTTDFADVFRLSPTFPFLLADRTLRNTAEAWAGYVQADFNVTEQVKLTAGIRYTDEIKKVVFSDNRASCNDGTLEVTCVDNANLISLAGARIPTRQQAKLWTPRFAINFKPNNDILLFASATRGFKSGGWNARGTAGSELLPFGPEKVWSYEAGIKSEFFDRKVRANLTVYYQDTADLQTPSAFIRANGQAAFITRNFADYRNKGAELELTFQPVANFNMYFNAGYQNDKYVINRNAPALDPFGVQSVTAQQTACLAQLAAGNVPGSSGAPSCGAGIITVTGQIAEPVRTPDITLAFGGSYKIPLTNSGWSITPSINFSYASSSETGTSGVSFFTGSTTGTNGTFPVNALRGTFIEGSLSEAHLLVNASLTVKGIDDHLSFGVDCTNCFNRAYVQSSLVNFSYYNRPMEWMIRAKYKY